MRYIYQNTARDGNGIIISSATVNVYLAGTTTVANVYTTLAGTSPVNSVTTGDDGSFKFYVDAFDYGSYQRYKVIVSKPSLTSTTFTIDDIEAEIVPGTYTISTAKTASYPVNIPYGVMFSKSGSGSLAFNSVEIGNYQVFNSFLGTDITLPDKLPVNVVWFGADMTGATTSTTALSAAFNAANINGGHVESRGNLKTGNPSVALNVGGTFDVWGTLTLTETFVQENYNVIGHGSATGVQFQIGEQAEIVPPSGNTITWKISKATLHKFKNFKINNPTGTGLWLDGTTALGALALIENIGILSANVSTSRPVVIDAFFWVWFKNCKFLSPASAASGSIYITTSSTTYSSAGLIFMDDCIIAGKGIKFGAQTTVSIQGNFFAKNIHFENLTEPPVLLDATYGDISGIIFEQIGISDSSYSPAYVVQILANPSYKKIRNIMFKNSPALLSGTLKLVTGGNIEGLVYDSAEQADYTTGWGIGDSKYGFASIKERFIYGDILNSGDNMAPSSVPYAPMAVDTDLSTWTLTGAVLTSSIVAPDGSSTAFKLVASPGEGSVQKTIATETVNVGDFFIAGVWAKPIDSSTLPVYYNSTLGLSKAGDIPLFNNGATYIQIKNIASYEVSTGWRPIVTYGKIIQYSGSCAIIFALKDSVGYGTCYWMPFVFHIPVAAGITEDEIIRWTKYLKNVNPNSIVGDVSLLDHQKLRIGGGVRYYSDSAAPVAGTWQVGDIVKNNAPSVGQPKGWVCTVAGTPGTWVSEGNL